MTIQWQYNANNVCVHTSTLHRRAALSSNSNGTRSVYGRENPKGSIYCIVRYLWSFPIGQLRAFSCRYCTFSLYIRALIIYLPQATRRRWRSWLWTMTTPRERCEKEEAAEIIMNVVVFQVANYVFQNDSTFFCVHHIPCICNNYVCFPAFIICKLYIRFVLPLKNTAFMQTLGFKRLRSFNQLLKWSACKLLHLIYMLHNYSNCVLSKIYVQKFVPLQT
jgi:hypothetical protein